MSELPLLELLYAALHSPSGVIVATPDPEFLRQKLYPVRKKYIAEFDCISFVISPLGNNDLWILRRPDHGQ